ncbi:MAG TPA: type I 3-dehydroquinate dehydratase [Syntrophales bacterium]|nr:type I 3-dehydroquinate dehydratase [Syntrophales bacterium]
MICISIVPATNEEALTLLGRALPLSDLVELRIDRIEKPDLPVLLHDGKERILVTNRCRDEGGFFASCENKRMALLHEAVELGARLVDIEARTGARAVGDLAGAIRAKGGKTRLIVSHHDMKGTPTRRTLERRLKACRLLGADIAKVVTMANTVEDNLRVLEIIPQALRLRQDIVAFCMGQKGRLSRVAAPLLGSSISYASLEEGAGSAPGQLTADRMRNILEILDPWTSH